MRVTWGALLFAAGCSLGPRLEPPTDRDNFNYLVALTFGVPALCERINPRADGGGGGSSPKGYQVQTLQSSCYLSLAAKLYDPSLCDRVVPAVSGRLDGRKIDVAYCRAQNAPRLVAIPIEMAPLVGHVRALGYGDPDVAEAEWAENPLRTPTYAAYKQVRDDEAFLERLRNAASYAEARGETILRDANPLEFLYEMVAVDRLDSALCAKISPNATFSDVAGGTELLFQKCRESSPSQFPRAADFKAALQQIGYSAADVDARIAKPTPERYWEFVSRLAQRGPEKDRDEFVRRAIALK